ncbi:hypothetical protein Ac2012v2_003698 [Leucoagaricus gongylophorus]
MLSLFPPPGPLLPPFFSLLATGAFHPSAPLHLAIGHVNESPKNEVLVLSPSRQRLEQKLASALDEWLLSSGTSNEARAVLSKITILFPPSPVHFSLLITTLDGIQSSPELLDLWAELPIIPTENLSMVIMDGISSYFAATDQVEFAMISLVNRVMQSISRVSRCYNRTNPIPLACFESTLLDMHMMPGLFQWVCHFESTQALSPVGVPSSQDEETVDILSGEMQIQKTLKMTSSQGEIEDDTIVVEYTEVVEFRRNCSLIRFVW